MTPTSSPAPTRSNGRRGLRAVLCLLLALVLTSCLKYDLTLIVNEDDTLDGTLIVAVAREFAAGQDIFGQSEELTPSEGSITKEAYEDADYVGSRYVIAGVPISEIDALSSDSSTRFSLTHNGDEYVLDASLTFNIGAADSIPTDDSFSAMVAMTFPGEVLESNGAIDGNTVTWTALRADADNSLTARASAVANGEAGSAGDSGVAWWIWALGAAGLLALAAIGTVIVLSKRRTAGAATATQAWQAQQPGGYETDAYGNWVPASGSGQPGYQQPGYQQPGYQQPGYYDSGQEGGYDSYYGTPGASYGQSLSQPYGGSYGESYTGPPGTGIDPSTGHPYGSYSGQTVVRPPDNSPASGWNPVPPP